MRHSCWKTSINYQNDKLPSAIKKRYFWWKDITKLLDKFKGIATVNLADGRTCLLWWDIWEGQICAQANPELLSFAKLDNLLVERALSSTSLDQLFTYPYPQKHTHNFCSSVKNGMASIVPPIMIHGTTFGARPFSRAPKLTNTWQVLPQSLHLLDGFGRTVASINTRFSFGYS